MLRTHTCGELRLSDKEKEVQLCGWVHRSRNKGGVLWIDLRDRYGITQLVFEKGKSEEEVFNLAETLGREFVISAKGKVVERYSKNPDLRTGEIEILVEKLTILNRSKTPPFTIEEDTDGGEDLRMKYRYLDLRRKPLQRNFILRHQLAQETRKFMSDQDFLEIETPFLIKSTPEGARDFVVPSRLHTGEFYALPQSPQTFKQLLMVSGYDKYFQIVKCFRDEDLRADRQPEFTQIDCEMAFVEQEDVLKVFEGMMRHLFKAVKGIDLPAFERMSHEEAMKYYGSDKPDLRFDMKFVELNEVTQGKGFRVFDDAEIVLGICVKGCADYTRKQLDELTDFVKSQQVGAKGLVYVKCNEDGSFKSSVDKFYSQEDLKQWQEKCSAKQGDLLLVLSGELSHTRKAMNMLRLEMANQLGLKDKNIYKPLWVTDFPLLEWDEEEKRWNAMHHPFTSPKKEDIDIMATDPGKVRANAYDMVINGVELGGGSIRIHNRELQSEMFKVLGMSESEANAKFGFLLNAFEYGAPPHGGIAFGFDRICALFGGQESIRDFIAFPQNNAARDVMLDAPSEIDQRQLDELGLNVKKQKAEVN